MTTTSELRVKFTHPSSPETKAAAFDTATTGKEAIAGLIEARFLTPESDERLYSLALDRGGKNQQLNLNKPLAEQGVKSGDTLLVLAANTGA